VPGFEEAWWIASEDMNSERLAGVPTPTNANPDKFRDACANSTRHWHKVRLVVLRQKIEEVLPDVHPSKLRCLFQLSRLLDLVGNSVESKWLLVRAEVYVLPMFFGSPGSQEAWSAAELRCRVSERK